jgi:hypothetical protein
MISQKFEIKVALLGYVSVGMYEFLPENNCEPISKKQQALLGL